MKMGGGFDQHWQFDLAETALLEGYPHHLEVGFHEFVDENLQ